MVTSRVGYVFLPKNLRYDVNDAARKRLVKTSVINKEVEKITRWQGSQLSHYKAGKYKTIDFRIFRRLKRYFNAILGVEDFDNEAFNEIFNQLCKEAMSIEEEEATTEIGLL